MTVVDPRNPQPVRSDEPIVYPDSDGQPMADNTEQYRWIVTITGGLESLFDSRPDVFVAGNLLWYPVEGRPDIRIGPDTLVAFGRPKGRRGSYRTWEEGGISPQVVFEVLSPSNRHGEMIAKFRFYERYGVEEYYVFDPDRPSLEGWHRQPVETGGSELVPIEGMNGWVSPRLGVRFELAGRELILTGPDGKRFVSFVEMARLLAAAELRAMSAEAAASQAQREAQAAQREAQAAQREAQAAQRRAEQLAERLRALGEDVPE